MPKRNFIIIGDTVRCFLLKETKNAQLSSILGNSYNQIELKLLGKWGGGSLPGTEMTSTDGHGLPIWKLKGQ